MQNIKLQNIYIFLMFLLCFSLKGCDKSNQGLVVTNQNTQDIKCPQYTQLPPDIQKVETINLNQNLATISGTVSRWQPMIYEFQGENKKQIKYYQIDGDVCINYFDAENRLVKDSNLLDKNNYKLLVFVPKGKTTYEGKLELKNSSTTNLILKVNDPRGAIKKRNQSTDSKEMERSKSKQSQKRLLTYNVKNNFQSQPSQELQEIVNEVVDFATKRGLPESALSITLINANTGEYAGYQEDKLRYPASIVKMFWMVIFYEQLKAGLLNNESEFDKDLNKMIKKSDNQAASRIIDRLTKTKSEAVLSEKAYQTSVDKRWQMSKFFAAADYQNINISQKTFPIPYLGEYGKSPKGWELKMRGDPHQPIRNKITTSQAARLMYEIVSEQAVSPEYSRKMKQLLAQDLRREAWENIDPNFEFNPIRSFFGEYLPSDIEFLSKAGWTSSTRQEVAFIRTRDCKTAYILSVFAEDRAYAYDGTKKFFPKISQLVFERMKERNKGTSVGNSCYETAIVPKSKQKNSLYSGRSVVSTRTNY